METENIISINANEILREKEVSKESIQQIKKITEQLLDPDLAKETTKSIARLTTDEKFMLASVISIIMNHLRSLPHEN